MSAVEGVNLPELIDQLDADLKTVTGLIRGNTLFSDGHDVSAAGRAEANESLAWYRERAQLLENHKLTAAALLANGYPDLPKQFASGAVIDEFKAFVASLTAATGEYLPPIEVDLVTELEPPGPV